MIPDIRDNGLDDLKSANRFSEQTYLNQDKEFLFVSFCVPFLNINDSNYCFKMIINQHVVPAAKTSASVTKFFLLCFSSLTDEL